MSKIQIWKRITTRIVVDIFDFQLYLICQRYKFESESQRRLPVSPVASAVFNMSKIQIWKRITTFLRLYSLRPWLYLICQRYKFESESQLSGLALIAFKAVFNMSKIQIWKRITTIVTPGSIRKLLYLICQRYKFESESQLEYKIVHGCHSCI